MGPSRPAAPRPSVVHDLLQSDVYCQRWRAHLSTRRWATLQHRHELQTGLDELPARRDGCRERPEELPARWDELSQLSELGALKHHANAGP